MAYIAFAQWPIDTVAYLQPRHHMSIAYIRIIYTVHKLSIASTGPIYCLYQRNVMATELADSQGSLFSRRRGVERLGHQVLGPFIGSVSLIIVL